MRRNGTFYLWAYALLMCASATALAGEPCTPFEQAHVDARLIQVMRDAAKQGRLYRVVPGESRVGFCVRHFPGKEYRGEFTSLVGGLTLPPAQDQFGQALLLIHTTDMASSNPDMDDVVRGHAFMDTARFPQILFIGRAFQWITPLSGYIYGDLTLHGKTNPVVFAIQVEAADSNPDGRLERIHLRGNGQVNRREYNMNERRLTVSETVRLCLSVELALQESSKP
jgi:polyisoprenoid-binding protein YceI